MMLLQRKLARDLLRLWSQVLTIALVVASAVGALLTTQACVYSLQAARDRFYVQAHMADVFASVRRAPRSVLPLFDDLPGVAQVQATVERPARLLLPGQVDPVMGHLVGVDAMRPFALNRPVLRQTDGSVQPGIWPGALRSDGVMPAWLSEGFAQARGLQRGQQLQVLMNGRLRTVEITGLALAPDVIFAGAMGMPDPRGYGVLWVDERALAAAWDLQGAFTRLTLRLAPGAREEAVLASLQDLLPRWGGRDAVPRRLQASHQMLDNEIQEQRLLGTVLPLVFTAVSIFLLHVVMVRLVATQREQIASLKALGFSNAALAWHQLQMVLVIAAVGVAVGGTLGWWAGRWLMGLYAEFFRFPELPLVIPASVWWQAVALAVVAAVLGAAQAMAGILRLSPAQAMQPPAPPRFSQGRWEVAMERALGLSLVLRMILRQLRRRPWRSLFSVLGMASALALVVMGNFFRDAIEHIVTRQFETVWRGDVQVITPEVVGSGAIRELARVPGVVAVEGTRSVAATVVHGHRSQRVQLRGLDPLGQQQRLVDVQGRVVPLSEDGLVLTDRLARKLGVRVGDELLVKLVEGPRPSVQLRVSHLVGETMGLNATTTRSTLNRLMQEDDRINALSLVVQSDELDAVLRATTRMPRVGGAFSKAHLLHNMQAVTARNIRIMSTIMTGFALIVAVGVVYNHARIALAERSWELASLRVLGLTRTEVAQLMVGEQALLLVMAVPLGMCLGWLLVWGLSVGLRSDQFQFPVVVWPRTYALGALSLSAAAAASAGVVWARVQGLDLVAALKTRE
ncbi:MAG: ABC transporter permease [Betaproteobacteria bacterium]|nr:ABC transporter permease [Betaproteobacteria bacterium]